MRFIFVVIIATLYYLMDIEGEYLFEKDGKPVFRILNEKTGKKERYIYVCCEECRKKRFQRYDKYRYRKTDLCLQCNGKNNLVVVPTHNLSATKVYQKYMNMLHRCYNPKCKSFQSYGGRGIGMCFEWIGENGLENFNKWCLEKGWTEDSKLQIDRIESFGIGVMVLDGVMQLADIFACNVVPGIYLFCSRTQQKEEGTQELCFFQ